MVTASWMKGGGQDAAGGGGGGGVTAPSSPILTRPLWKSRPPAAFLRTWGGRREDRCGLLD